VTQIASMNLRPGGGGARPAGGVGPGELAVGFEGEIAASAQKRS